MSEYSEPMQFIDLAKQQKKIRPQIESSILRVLDHGKYIMGPEVREFESELCKFTGSEYALTCANGTDALSLVLMAWDIGPGDAVFVPSFTYVASAEAPAQLGATPIFVDVAEETFNIDSESLKQAIKDCVKLDLRPAVVIAVDLFGQPADIDEIMDVAHCAGIKVLIDGAQSFGATSKGRKVGSMGDATTTSFFPAKPLGCYGDGGAVFTNNKTDADVINSIRLHGKGNQKYDNVRIGLNSRLDTLQAAILLEKIKIFPEELKLRQIVANLYSKLILSNILKPKISEGLTSAWAQYTLVLDNRDKVKEKLQSNNIPSVVYYPKALSQQNGYKKYPVVSTGVKTSEHLSGAVLSLPMHPYMKEEEIIKIAEVLNTI